MIAMLGASAILFSAFAAIRTKTPVPLPRLKAADLAKTDRRRPRKSPARSSRPARASPISSDLKTGLDALSNKDAAKAIAVANAMAKDTLDRHILTWAIAVSGQKGVPSYEIADAQRELKGWPGLGALRANSERALYRENPAAADVLSAFGTTRPETADGTIVLARAFQANGDKTAAAKLLRGALVERCARQGNRNQDSGGISKPPDDR